MTQRRTDPKPGLWRPLHLLSIATLLIVAVTMLLIAHLAISEDNGVPPECYMYISVIRRCEGGYPMYGGEVVLSSPSGIQLFSDFADIYGTVRFLVPSGDYIITVSAYEYETQTKLVNNVCWSPQSYNIFYLLRENGDCISSYEKTINLRR